MLRKLPTTDEKCHHFHISKTRIRILLKRVYFVFI